MKNQGKIPSLTICVIGCMAAIFVYYSSEVLKMEKATPPPSPKNIKNNTKVDSMAFVFKKPPS